MILLGLTCSIGMGKSAVAINIAVAAALAEIKGNAAFYKVVGSYPRAST